MKTLTLFTVAKNKILSGKRNLTTVKLLIRVDINTKVYVILIIIIYTVTSRYL